MQRTKMAISVHQALAAIGAVCLIGYSAQGHAQTSTATPTASAPASTPSDQDKSGESAKKKADHNEHDQNDCDEPDADAQDNFLFHKTKNCQRCIRLKSKFPGSFKKQAWRGQSPPAL